MSIEVLITMTLDLMFNFPFVSQGNTRHMKRKI